MTKYASGILDIVSRPGGHLTAEQIFWEMKREYPAIVMATVYNNLNALCAQGAIRRLRLEGQPDRYDRTIRHDHMVCRRCGELTDVFIGDLTDRLRAETGFEVDFYELKISWICKKCREKEASAEREERSNPTGRERGVASASR